MSQSFAAVETLEIKLEAQVYNHAENTYVYIYTPSGYLTQLLTMAHLQMFFDAIIKKW